MTRKKNLPAVVGPPIWAPEKHVTFRGHNGRRLVVELPGHPIANDPVPADALWDAWACRDGLLVWNLIEKAGIR
jgi:hypothetical protein